MPHGYLRNCSQGFSLVELVMVLILVGILSVGTVSLFSGANNYSSFIAKDLLVSQALLAQQVALGDTANANPVTLNISTDAEQWQFNLQKVGADSVTVQTDHNGNSLSVDGTTMTAASTPVSITWSNDATITDGSHLFEFTGPSTYRVCLSAQGFAYELDGAAACR